MLTEQLIASIGTPTKALPNNVAKDAGIFSYEFQPLTAQRTIFKKSTTPPNCLAISRHHVFAAQTDKAVIHVYNREKGTQEATVPFTERITAVALACNDAILVLGTADGRIFLWETATGRQITTLNSHLQAINAVAVDPISNLLLSASADSTVHVWSLPLLLSFANTGIEPPAPMRTFTAHRTSVTAIAMGHSRSFCSIAVSASDDKTCLVWDFHTGMLLRTYLLPASPQCLALDAADRAIYVGYDDGTLQQLDIYASGGGRTRPAAVQNNKDATRPVQPPPNSRWTSPDTSYGPVLSLSVSFDSSIVLSGHESGAILSWEVGRGALRSALLQQPLPGPVNNLHFLPVSTTTESPNDTFVLSSLSKPKFGAYDNADGMVPGNYSLNAELPKSLVVSGRIGPTEFLSMLEAPTFPADVIDRGLDELARWKIGPAAQNNADTDEEVEDFMAFDTNGGESSSDILKRENADLRTQLEALRNLQKASFKKMEKLNSERRTLLEREQRRSVKLTSEDSE